MMVIVLLMVILPFNFRLNDLSHVSTKGKNDFEMHPSERLNNSMMNWCSA